MGAHREISLQFPLKLHKMEVAARALLGKKMGEGITKNRVTRDDRFWVEYFTQQLYMSPPYDKIKINPLQRTGMFASISTI